MIRELRRQFPQLQVQEVLDARDFEQAIAHDAFHAVVTDYQLGWSNGLEVLRTVKSQYPRCPVVMFTNTGTEEIAVEALQSGLDDYVLKEPSRYIRVPTAIRVALERIEAQRQAALFEIRLQRLLNQVKVGIFRSQPDGTLLESNPAFLELLHVQSLAEANELNLFNIHACYVQLISLPLPQKLEQEIHLQRSDGTQVWTLLTTTLDTVEGVTVLDGLLEDITDRKEHEAVLQQLNATLEVRIRERTAQLEAANQDLEEFAYSVSHDLRAPLRTIQGYAQGLFEDVGHALDPDNLEYLQRIAANAQYLDTLIADLLTYSRLRQTEVVLEAASLSMVFTDVLRALEPEIKAQKATIRIEEPLPTVQANRLILVQVLTNLLSNAIKFVLMGQQSQVRVWAELREGHTRIWIEDNGIGIAADHHQQIFRPFTRLHGEEEYPGTGIGLAIARKGIERMGGQIGVESQPGQGSRFWIELPTVMESA